MSISSSFLKKSLDKSYLWYHFSTVWTGIKCIRGLWIELNFISEISLDDWKNNFVRIKKDKSFFKEYNVEKIENKLFQTRVFFPAESIPGEYLVNVYQIKNNVILYKKEKIITLKKSGIWSQIYDFAHKNAAAYGLFAIIFAILSGFLAATLFRRS